MMSMPIPILREIEFSVIHLQSMRLVTPVLRLICPYSSPGFCYLLQRIPMRIPLDIFLTVTAAAATRS